MNISTTSDHRGSIKNVIILILISAVVILLFRQRVQKNSTFTDSWVIEKANHADQTNRVATPAATDALPSPRPAITTPHSSTRHSYIREQIAQEVANLAFLTRDQVELEQQIKNADPAVINQEMKSVQGEIGTLQSQITYYQSGQAAAEQTAAQQLQYLDTLSRQMSVRLSSQISRVEGELRIARHDLLDANLNSDINDPDRVDRIQTNINQLKEQIRSLQEQKDQISSQSIDQIAQIRSQASSAEANIVNIQNALRTQIDYLQNSLIRLQSEKDRSENILDSLNREVVDRLEQAKNIQTRIVQLKSQLKAVR